MNRVNSERSQWKYWNAVVNIKQDFAFVEIVILWLAIAVTIYLFWPVNAIASMLLLPYILWYVHFCPSAWNKKNHVFELCT